MNQLNEKLIRSRAKESIRAGEEKQITYQKLTEEFGHPDSIAKIVRRIPSLTAWKKYGVWNHVLSVLMILLFLIMMLTSPSIGTFIWYGLPTIALLMRKTRFYFWIAILATIGTISIIALTISSSSDIPIGGIVMILIFLLLLLPSTFLAIWLPNKLTPKPAEEREFYENENGEQRSRIVYRFA